MFANDVDDDEDDDNDDNEDDVIFVKRIVTVPPLSLERKPEDSFPDSRGSSSDLRDEEP
jgi:hypothetical protein